MSVFSLSDNNLSKYQEMFFKLPMCISIVVSLWICALGLLIGKFRQFLTDLSACITIVAGCYRLT